MNEWDHARRRRDEAERARHRQDQLHESAAKRQVELRGLRGETLAPGWTWNQVLSAHAFSWAVALAYWDECRRIEREYPGYRYWEPQPPAPPPLPPYEPPRANPRPPGGRWRSGRADDGRSAPRDERRERLLGWAEHRQAWEIWTEGMRGSGESDEPDRDT